jgi:threonine dehydratase
MVTLAEIERARRALPPQVVRTPLIASQDLSAVAGGPVWFKLENLQVTGSYKSRAAFTILNNLSPEQKARGAALSSSGNFASAFAYMGRLLGIPTAVVMMDQTSPLKVAKSRRYGAEIVLCGNNFEERWRVLDRLQAERGITAVNTFESPDVVAGHGTLGLEILDDLPEVDTVLIPVSSGGLIAGVATAIKERRPGVRIVGVQPEGSNAVTESVRRGEPVRIPEVRTICDALIAQTPGRLPFTHIQRYVDDMVLVTDDEVKAAIRWLVEYAKQVVEAGGAVCAAALLTSKATAQGNTVALLSGGNIAPATLAQYLRETEA